MTQEGERGEGKLPEGKDMQVIPVRLTLGMAT